LNSEVQISKPAEQKNFFIIFFYLFLISLAFSLKIADYLIIFMLIIFIKKIIKKEVKLESSPIMLSSIFLMSAYILSFFFNFMNYTDRHKAIHQHLLLLIAPLLLYIIISSIGLSKKQLKNSLLIIVFSSCAAFILYFFICHPPYSLDNRFNFFNHPNIAALYIAMYCIILFSSLILKDKFSIQIGKLVMLFIGLAGLIFTFCRSAWMGVFAGIALLCALIKRRNVIIVFLILMILMGSLLILSPGISARFHSIFLTHDYPSNTSRMTIWSTGLKIFNKQKWFAMGPNKLIGIGPGNFKKYFEIEHPIYFEGVWHAQNDFLQMLTEFGFLGFLSFLFFMFILCYQAFKSR
jgi:O-antigen ligase